jgi:hypothetical protein
MLAAWSAGIRESLGLADRPLVSLSSQKVAQKRRAP